MIKKIAVTIKNFIFKHKIISLIIVLVLSGGAYWLYASLTNTSGVTRYVLADVTKGTIISSVSGTGQVSTSDQMDIKPQVSGKIVYINIPKDKDVRKGTLLAQIESRDAQKAVQSAENDLANAQLSSQDVNGNAKDALDLSYSNGLSTLTTTFSDLTSMKANLDSMFLKSSYEKNDSNIDSYLYLARFYDGKTNDLSFWTDSANKKYTDIQDKLDTIEQKAWTLNINSQPSQIENTVVDIYDSTKIFLDLIRQTSNLVQRYQKIYVSENLTTSIAPATTTTQATQLSDALSLLVKDTTALSAAKTDITTQKQNFSKVSVNTQAQNLNIQQYQNALLDAKDNLAKYYIYAPIDGIISASDSTITTGDTVSSGTVLGSIVTKKEIIVISLSETDIPKIKLGQKATITFDALPNMTATGSVIDIDTVGTVTQGVVNYGVKIALDISDSQIKPGMSGNVNVITDTQQNVLSVPNSAVKTKNGASYVLVLAQKQDLTNSTASQGFLSATAPTQKTVQVGLADDTNTQIISGLSEGDQVVVRTISSAATASATSASSANRIPGLTGGAVRVNTSGGGNFRPGD